MAHTCFPVSFNIDHAVVDHSIYKDLWVASLLFSLLLYVGFRYILIVLLAFDSTPYYTFSSFTVLKSLVVLYGQIPTFIEDYSSSKVTIETSFISILSYHLLGSCESGCGKVEMRFCYQGWKDCQHS